MLTDAIRLMVFPALMAFAASSDLFTMTISNRITLALVGGFVAVALISGMSPSDMLAHAGAAAAVLAFGVGISWLYGREFADGTIPGLFGLPVGRGAIATAKLLVYLAWAVAVTLVVVLLLLAGGLAVGLGAPDSAAIEGLARLFVLGVLTALIAVPAGWAASLGRGLLPGIAVAVGILVVAQVSVIADLGAWVPFVAPAFWAMHADISSTAALVVVPVVPLVFGAATVIGWRRLELDK